MQCLRLQHLGDLKHKNSKMKGKEKKFSKAEKREEESKYWISII